MIEMDVWDYVNTQGHKTAAFLDAYTPITPIMQQAAELYGIAARSGILSILSIVHEGHEFTNQFVDIGQHLIAAELQPLSPEVSYLPDFADEFTYDPGVSVPVDHLEGAAKTAAEEYALAEDRRLKTTQEELRKQHDADLQDPAKLEAEKQDAARLEAQWEANRKSDELAQQSRQQEAEQKVTDSLFEAVRKDQPQELEIRELQDEQEKVRADQAAQMAEFRDKLADKYADSPEQEKHLEEFDKAAKAADDALARRQDAELQKLQEQQLERPNPTDPSRDR
jgi:hypothetical protein